MRLILQTGGLGILLLLSLMGMQKYILDQRARCDEKHGFYFRGQCLKDGKIAD